MMLSEQHHELQREIRDFAEKKLRSTMMKHSRGPEFPLEAYAEICRAGYMGFMLPKEYGGKGNGVVDYCILLEELSRVDHNLPWVMDVTFVVANAIAKLGSEEQKKRYLPGLIDGSIIPAFALTDLSGGSNVRAMSTHARRENDGAWNITGRKVHIHNCEHAKLWLLFAGSESGQEAFLLEEPKGIVIEKSYQPFGFRCAPCHQVFFDDVRATDADILGQRGKGVLAALMGGLNYTRIGNASIVIGIARAAFEVALSFAIARQVKDGVVTDQQAVQHIIADLATELDAASLLRWQAAFMHDRGLNPVKEASQAKLYATEKATHICGTLLRFLGAYGTYEELPLSDYMTSCKTLELGSGASEIHRNNIAREVLNKYRKLFADGELFHWAQTEAQRSILMINERAAKVMNAAE
jgi:alkylation response protein AidB-like acyl-CoA dehydrogenase